MKNLTIKKKNKKNTGLKERLDFVSKKNKTNNTALAI